MFASIPLLCIAAALGTGFVLIVIPSRRLAQSLVLCLCGLLTLLSLLLCVYLTRQGTAVVFRLGHLGAPWGNELRAGPMEAVFSAVYAAVLGLSLCGCEAHSLHEIHTTKQSRYFALMCFLLAAMLALIYTNDLFTAYVFLELSTIAACGIILVRESGDALAETMRYLILYLIASGCFLLGVVLLYSITGQLLMEPLRLAIEGLTVQGSYPLTLGVSLLLLLVGLTVKSAIFPFHSVLPGAHGSAVAASSAVLSALLLESYILLAIKIIYRVFGAQLTAQLHVFDCLLVFGLMAMVAGSLAALREGDIKRMLAYSSVAQIGYIYVGLGLGTAAGLVAAAYHIIAHAQTKAMLFLCAGSMSEQAGHQRSFQALRSVAWRDPLAAIGFTLGGISLVGVPLLACFVSKLYLAQSALDGTWRSPLVFLALGASMILNALYFMPALASIWARPPLGERVQIRSPAPALLVSISLQIVLNIGLGLCYPPLIRVLELGFSLL